MSYMEINPKMEINGWCPSENTQRQMNHLAIGKAKKGMAVITGACKTCGNSAKRAVCLEELSFLMPIETD